MFLIGPEIAPLATAFPAAAMAAAASAPEPPFPRQALFTLHCRLFTHDPVRSRTAPRGARAHVRRMKM